MMQQIYDRALKDVGQWEWAEGHNPKVIAYFKDAGAPGIKDDETAWCAAFVGAMLEREGIAGTKSLAARSYERWGEEVPSLNAAQKGDIVVFWRGSKDGWQGHVGFYAGHGSSDVMVLGGNQRNQVNISSYSQSQLLSIRRAPLSAAVAAQKSAPASVVPEPAPEAPVPAPAPRLPNEKPWYASTGVWGGILAALAGVGSFAGVTLTPEEMEGAAMALASLGASIGGVVAIIGRIKANRAIS